MPSYKQEKEDFVSGHNGSTVYHINAISTAALASVALYLTLQSRLAFPFRLSSGSGSRVVELSAEYLLLVAPLVLSLTLFANHPLSLMFLLLFPAFAIHRALPTLPPLAQSSLLPPPSPSVTRSPSPSRTPTRAEHSSLYVTPTPNLTPTPRQSTFPKVPPSSTIHVPPLPALTTYRAHMMIMTVIAILAVDFPVFPRALSKCESWGVSVMDLGVGSFVFSQGIVSAVPVIKNPGLLRDPLLPKVLVATKKVIPLLVLGLIRVLAVKGTEYPEHVTEYGVHWNFFITLALLPPLSVLFHPLIVYAPLSLLGLVLTLVHQTLLTNTSLQDWALGNNRANLLDQNKEGIVSFVGYLSIHLLGMAIGTLILPPSPSHFRRAVSEIASKDNSAAPSRTPSRAPSPARLQVDHDLHMGRRPATPDSSDDDEPRKKAVMTVDYATENQSRKRGKAAVELCSYAIVWWSLFYLAGTLSGSGADEPTANTMYVLWVVAFNTTFLVGYVLLEGIWGPRSQPAASDRLRGSNSKGFTPSFKLPGGPDSIRERNGPTDSGTSGLLEAINLNGLALFLVANIATGLVNMTIPTMYTPDGQAMLVLFGPQGSNPYTYAADFVATIIPPKPHWYFANIIASGIVAAINLISTIACFLVMWRRSQAGTGIRTFQVGILQQPKKYELTVVHSAIIRVQPYIWLNYFAYHTPSLQLTSRMYFWYGFVFIWDATGMWTSAFGTLYATLLPKLFTVTPSSHSSVRGFLLHPITLNVLCFMPPFGLALTQVITSTYSAIAWSDLVHTQFGLIDLLTTLAGQWAQSAAHSLDRALVKQAGDTGTLFLIQKEKSQIAFQKNAWTCGAWYLLCIVLFTPTAIWLLWVIRDTISQRSRRVTPHAPPPTTPTGLPIQQPHPTAFGDAQPRSSFAPFSRGHPASPNVAYKPSPTPGAAGANWTTNSQAGQNQDDSIKPLKRALLTASLQFAATFFCLGVASGSWLWIAADAGRLIVNPTLHALAILLTIWVYVIVGCLVNLFILIRTRRPDDSPANGNNMPLSAIKASHASSSQSHTRSDPERKPVYIIAHTTTHVVVDDPHRSSGSDHAADVTSDGRQPYDGQGDMESAYSLNSAHFAEDPAKIKTLDDAEWSKR
ncbi:unnamed protein product [Rhizoctonia solani]|uniref:GPI-anchored wall transfer protein 1 n=1 Tax=Rhizoctonia solani TaxID=456999 RepID=A0A8H2ZZ45_9AGAM|nr:unnamed protein product [Rhizoctonia solani]